MPSPWNFEVKKIEVEKPHFTHHKTLKPLEKDLELIVLS
jgi:hypothetical protein